jgi:hypothetical protein
MRLRHRTDRGTYRMWTFRKPWASWTLTDKLTLIGIMSAIILGVLGTLITIYLPELRIHLGLDKPKIESNAVPPGQHSEPETKPEVRPPTEPQRKPSVKGHGNVAGSKVSANGNVAGKSNQVNPPPAAPIQINSAPNGIAIGGGTVVNPTVNNNYTGQTKPDRTVTDADRINIVTYLSQIKATVSLKAPLGDKEATNYAILWYGIFKDARWIMKDRIVLAYMTVGGNPQPGAILYEKGEPPQPGKEISVPNTDPVAYVANALKSQNVPISLQRDFNQEEGVITIQFGPRPD